MRSQGEGGVDRIVHERFFTGVSAGVFVDVGAAGPDFLSMSALYREAGWRVIAIEPNPAFCEAHRAAGHEVLQYACSDHDEDAVDFEVVDSHGEPYEGGTVSYEAFSSLQIKPEYRFRLKSAFDVTTIKVDVRRLDTLLEQCDLETVDAVSIDVEGWELEVLDGFDLDRYRPAVLIIENLAGESRYIRALRNRGYRLWRRRSPNDVYVRDGVLSRRERAMTWLRETFPV